MKNMKTAWLGFGVVMGVAALLAWQHPEQVAAKVKEAVSAAEKKIEELKFNHCRTKFLERTHCFQGKSSADECFEQIQEECGKP